MSNYKPIQLRWTTHALERAMYRFGGKQNVHIPSHLVCKMFRMSPDGAVKRLLHKGVEYVLSRKPDAVLVVTLYAGGDKEEVHRDLRRKYRRYTGDHSIKDRRVRRGTEIGEWDEYCY